MKLHLPSSLRTALLSCLSAAFVLTTGSGMLQAGEQELTFNGATLNWTTAPENQVFTAADSSPAAFAPGDNVYFTGTTQVTLGEDIAVGILGVEAGAHVDITPGAYALKAERIELSGTLDYGSALHIGEGQTLAVESADSVLDSALVLQDNGAIEVAAVANLNNNSLSMQGGTALSLDTTGDGRVYNLFTGVSSLLDAQGNTLVLNTTNNAVSNYFDTTRPGTGFWAGATLQLTTDGTLQLVRHSETVKDAVEFTTRQSGSVDYSYYEGVTFRDINYSSSGGAIYGAYQRSITLNNNGSVTFCGNSASSGGAIYGGSYCTITLNNNGCVTFSENSASSGGSAIQVYDSTITLSNNGRVTFNENSATSTDNGIRGGVIYGVDSAITLSNNGSVTFRENSASTGADIWGGVIKGDDITLKNNDTVTFNGNSAYSTTSHASGGAICGDNSIIVNNNSSVTFCKNSASTDSISNSCADGGAILGGYYCTIALNNNGGVTFCGNSASSRYCAGGGAIEGESPSTITLNNNSSVTFCENSASASGRKASTAVGGAILSGEDSTITLNDNGSVTFCRNSATITTSSYTSGFAWGGAIYGDLYSTITLNNNGSVTFSENSASYTTTTTSSGSGNGGAIYGYLYSTITLNNNGSVTFSENSASCTCTSGYDTSCGGAIYGTANLSNNGSVTFRGNSVNGIDSYGGAIYRTANLSNNGSVTFRGNSVNGIRSHGGAIYGTTNLSDNGSVTFSGNSATASSSDGFAYVYGGAIDGSTITLSDNGSVTFSGNSATASASDGSAYVYGGAIRASRNLIIQNNDSVLFEKNAEITEDIYRLRSIYASDNRGIISLSAAEGKSIEFRDSVYIASGSTVELNANYTNSEGKVIKQEGDIIFTGAYTEAHLNELLTAAGAGRTATAKEIANSRTSEMHGKVTLYGGTLRVEEQAVLKTTAGLDVVAGSNATVKVSNAALDAGSSDINVGDSGTLMLMNGATVKAANINIANGATFAVVAAPSQEAVATFSLREAVSVAEPPQSCLVGANLTLEAGSTLVADGVYFSMAEGSTLTFKALTGGDKINLVLTLGAEYSDSEQVVLFSDVDVVRFILDGVELSTTDTLLANTFFTGAWVNDETTLSYNSSNGTISLQHLNTVTIPEPTTATLSLLALAGLAARRRRK